MWLSVLKLVGGFRNKPGDVRSVACFSVELPGTDFERAAPYPPVSSYRGQQPEEVPVVLDPRLPFLEKLGAHGWSKSVLRLLDSEREAVTVLMPGSLVSGQSGGVGSGLWDIEICAHRIAAIGRGLGMVVAVALHMHR